MPIYEYQCGNCGHEFEREQRISDDPVKTCPVCRSRKVKRLISQTSFVLKGGGWYSDLYSSNGKKGGDSEGSPERSDSKPEDSGDKGGKGGKGDKKKDKKASKGSGPKASSSPKSAA